MPIVLSLIKRGLRNGAGYFPRKPTLLPYFPHLKRTVTLSSDHAHVEHCRIHASGGAAMAFSDTSKRRLLYASAIVLLLIAAATMLLGQYNFVTRSAGLIALFGCLKLSRAARSVAQFPSVPATSALPPPSRAMWLVGAALVVIQVITAYLLYAAAAAGGKEVWPVYAFAANGLACAAFLPALFARWQQ